MLSEIRAWLTQAHHLLQRQGGSTNLRPAAPLSKKDFQKKVLALEKFALETTQYLQNQHEGKPSIYYETKLAFDETQKAMLEKKGYNCTGVSMQRDEFFESLNYFEMERVMTWMPGLQRKVQARQK